MASNVLVIGLVSVAALAVWWDLRERRIPNALTLAGCGAALLLRATQGLEPLGAGVVGLLLGLGLALPLVVAGGLGGGDAKLLAAVGAFLGPANLLVAALITALAGGLLAMVAAVRNGALRETALHAGSLVLSLFGRGGRLPRRTLDTAGALTIPYAVPIAVGALTAAWLA
ncbi:hypothetical protein BH18GEM1_BH18GEM1_04540 [soil metagenome]